MPKFGGTHTRVAPPKGPTATTVQTVTHEGGVGFEKDAKTALYTLAVTNMVSETSFYESAGGRDKRFADLVHEVTGQDPEWVAGMVPWLRNEANMRSASIVVACEYVKAGGPNGRRVIDEACSRADEPAEVIGYWLATYGRKIPQPVKRGVADACARLYTQRAALKYDGNSRGIRMADVIELVHATPKDVAQSRLFRFLIDKRHNRPNTYETVLTDGLATVAAAHALDSLPADQRRPVLRERGPEALAEAGYTWERLSGWLPGGMDAEAWEAVIPSLGYMASIRNLRNFEQAGVSKPILNQVAAKIADPDEVARSRQFPYRFWSAYKNSGTIRFGAALEDALELSVRHIPVLSGRTLVMIDTSGSMRSPVSSRSAVGMLEIGALFAGAVAGAGSKVDLCPYANTTYKAEVQTSVLRTVQDIVAQAGQVGHGTNTWPCTLAQYDGHDRIIVFTDCQDHPSRAEQQLDRAAQMYGRYQTLDNGLVVPAASRLPDVPVYVWDLKGYGAANVDLSTPGRYLFSGFSDSAFKLIGLLEAGRDANWPWLQR